LGYIYKITNDINGKMYVGKTELADPYDRWKEHIHDYNKRRCEKRPLYDAMNKYGIEHFYFEVIEKTDNTEEREQYWIEKLCTYVGFKDCNGYNATLGGDGKPYLNLDEGEVIKYHTKEANYIAGRTAEHFLVDRQSIKKILRKNNIPWLTHADSNNMKTYEVCGGIFQVDVNSKYILNVFENIPCANLYMGKDKDNRNIIKACNNKINRKTHKAYGYLWYYGKDIPEAIKNGEVKEMSESYKDHLEIFEEIKQ